MKKFGEPRRPVILSREDGEETPATANEILRFAQDDGGLAMISSHSLSEARDRKMSDIAAEMLRRLRGSA